MSGHQEAEGESSGESLKDRLATEMRMALKAGEKVRLGALRLLAASVKNREVELLRPVSGDEFREVVVREVKRRREAAEAYRTGNREDRAALEEEERDVLQTYLPAGLGEEDVVRLIDEAVAATGASGPGDVGPVMGYVMGKARGRVDGKAVQALVRARLEG